MKKTWLGIIKDLQKIALVLVICGIITTCVCYFYRDLIYKFLTHPLSDALHKDYAEIFIYTSIFESFIADISISVYSSIFILLPLLLICIYWFVAKSLYRQEKQMFAIILCIADLGNVSPYIHIAEQILIYIALILTIISMVDYFAKNLDVLKEGGSDQ